MESAKHDEILGAVAGPVLKTLKEFVEIEEDDIGAALLIAHMLSSNDNSVSEADAGVIVKWGRRIQMMATMLQFVLAGVSEITVENGEVAFRLKGGGEDVMRRLVEAGIAKPAKQSEPSQCPE